MRYIYLCLLFIICSCNNQPTQANVLEKNFDTTKRIGEKKIEEKPITTHKLVSDSVRKLIDELGLCQIISENNCYDVEYSTFINLTSDSTYSCFLFAAGGGSGGQDIVIYKKNKSGGYKTVNYFFGFYDHLSGTITNGFYDLVIASRDYTRGSIKRLFKWNGKKYVQRKILSVNDIPIDLLLALGITDKKKLSNNYPYIGEKTRYASNIYGKIYIDTIKSVANQLELLVKTSNNPNYGFDKTWKVIYSNGKYSLMKEKQ